MGRPPKPTQLKLLHGDDRKNPGRVNRTEPKPARANIEAPDWLPGEAADVWRQYAPGLITTGVLTEADVEGFASYCEAVIRRRDAVDQITRFGAVLESDLFNSKGDPIGTKMVKSPWTLVLKEADAQMVHWGSRFGLTPADRTRISVGGADRGASTDDLFGSSGT